VNVQEKVLQPNDEVTIGKRHKFTIRYQPPAGRAAPVPEAREENVLGKSLLEKAGLQAYRGDDAQDDEEEGRRGYEIDPAELRRKDAE